MILEKILNKIEYFYKLATEDGDFYYINLMDDPQQDPQKQEDYLAKHRARQKKYEQNMSPEKLREYKDKQNLLGKRRWDLIKDISSGKLSGIKLLEALNYKLETQLANYKSEVKKKLLREPKYKILKNDPSPDLNQILESLSKDYEDFYNLRNEIRYLDFNSKNIKNDLILLAEKCKSILFNASYRNKYLPIMKTINYINDTLNQLIDEIK